MSNFKNDNREEIIKNLNKDMDYYEPWHKKVKLPYKSIFILFIVISLTIFITYIYNKISIKYGKKKAYNYVQFPFIFVSSLFIFFGIYKIGYQTYHLDTQTQKSNNLELSKFTQRVVVDGWEDDAMKYGKDLNKMYENIFSKPSGSNNGFMSKEEWYKLGLKVPYVSYKGNEIKWHYAAKFVQEMTNIYRMNDLNKKYKIGNIIDLEKSKLTAYAGWLASFRMWMSNPIVRNVFEQYKYRHINPEFSAWIKYFITNPLDEDPNYWKNHKNNWNIAMDDLLKK